MSYGLFDKLSMFHEFEKYLSGYNPGYPVKRPDSTSQNKPGTNTDSSHEEGVKANTGAPPVDAVRPDTPSPPVPALAQPDPPTPPVEVKNTKESYPDTPAAPESLTSLKPPPVRGITLAEKVRLPVEHLKLVGLREIKRGSRIAVQCPYWRSYFDCAAVRCVRSAWSRAPGQLFTWERGPALALVYGLDWLDARRRDSKWVLLVTGELNCWVAWCYRLPVVALPEQSVWNSEWAQLFDGMEVYLWRSPGASTELEKRIAVDIPDLRVILAPTGIKDLNAAYRKGKYLPTYLADLKKTSISLAKTPEQKTADLREALYAEARPVIEAKDPLEKVRQAITALGYGGDVKFPLITYLSMTSRMLDLHDGEILPHLLLHGSSSSGKSFIVNTIKKCCPPRFTTSSMPVRYELLSMILRL